MAIAVVFAVISPFGSALAETFAYPQDGGTGTSTPPTYGQLLVGNANGTYTLTATSSLNITVAGDGVGNWFTPVSYGNATSTTIGFLNGFLSTASSTFSHLGTGGLAVNNGLVYNAATSTLSTITGTLSIAKGGTGVTSITGDRLWYSNDDGSALLEIATSSLSIGGNAGTATALFANGANCSAGNYPLGVDASGAVEDCTAASTGTVTSIATTYPITGGTITTTGTLGIAFGTTTANTWAETQTFTKAIVINEGTTATSTFAGNVEVTGNLQVDGQFFAPVTLVTSGNTTIDGNLTVTGQTTLNTSLTGLAYTSSGVVSAITNGTIGTTGVLGLSAGVPAYVATSTLYGVNGISNSALANSTISGVALGSNLANLTNDVTLVGSSYNGSGAISDWGLNLANANTWSVLQQFALASSTQFSAATEMFYINSVGRVQAKDTTNGWSGVVSPTHSFGFTMATTTTWTGTSSAAYVIAAGTSMPFAGTLRSVYCNATTTGAYLGVKPFIGTSAPTPSYFVASNTPGIISFTANNTFTKGQVISAYVGSSTAATANVGITCTFDATETY